MSKVRYEYEIKNELDAPVNINEEVGEIKIFIDNDLHFSEKVFTMESVRRSSVWAKVKEMIEQW